MHPAVLGIITIIVGVSGCVGYFYGANLLLDKVLFPAKGPNMGRNINRREMIRPWVFLFPALAALGLYLAYPVFATLRLSFLERLPGNEYVFVGFKNYTQMFAEDKFREALKNNILWLIVVPAASTVFGLLAAQLTDRLRWGTIAKSIIFMPMAISFVGAAVIFKLVYEARPADVAQIGALNAIWLKLDGGVMSVFLLKVLPFVLLALVLALTFMVARTVLRFVLQAQVGVFAWILRGVAAIGLGVVLYFVVQYAVSTIGLLTWTPQYGVPQQWLTIPIWNSLLLMVVLIWIQTGFAMVILSAALRGVPEETVEAAIIDGANPFQIFFKIKMPQIVSTIVVVWTTITIATLKVFDIVFAMTNGQWETQVLANYMYAKMFVARDWGMGSASAMIIMLLVMPILVWNVYNARKEMK